DEIPDVARIIGIADAYDAMTSNRVYRKRLSQDKVIGEIKRGSGTQFDPEIAETFVKMIEDGKLDDLSPDVIASGAFGSGMAEQSAALLQSVIGFKGKAYDNEHDYLTGTLTRSAGESAVSEALGDGDGGLFIVDITNLHDVNEKHGIVAGDRMIKTTSEALAARAELIVARYDGSAFLCFAPGITDDEALDGLMTGICGGINKTLRTMPEYENNLICVGGALSSEAGRELPALLSAADKALFYIKELEQKGCYLYKKAPKEDSGSLYGLDLEQLIRKIADGSSCDTDPPEFAKIYDLVKGIYEKNKNAVQLVLLTVTPALGKTPAVADRDEAMEYLQNAIDVTVGESVVTFRFSSVQCMAILTDPEKESAEEVTERILNSFYKFYDKKNVALTAEAASLPPIVA
ncbi:MAG: diguanylate cyclase, partial [Ruminococcus sp.]|nr:diguanylate cyclase [Ruminococcus sp.]